MSLVMTAPQDELHSVTDWSAALWAGVIAGAVFMMLEMAMVWLFMGESPVGAAAHDRRHGPSARRS